MSPLKNPFEAFMHSKPTVGVPAKSPTSMKQRIMVVAGGTVLLIIILFVVFGVLLKGSTKGVDSLYQVAASQDDIVALVTLGNDNVKDQQLLNSSASISAVVSSHLVQTKASIKKIVSTKKSTPAIKALRDSAYEKSLTDAKASGTYDATFKTLLSNRLAQYRSYLQDAYNASSSKSIKNQLNEQYKQINELALPAD